MKDYSSYGEWIVTTEGDVEGRSTQNLGVHEGYVDEIALSLANRSYYILNFRRTNTKILKNVSPTKDKTNIKVEGMTDSSDRKYRVEEYKKFFAGRDIFVTECNYYASVTISKEKELSDREVLERDLKRNGIDIERVRKIFGKG